MKFSGIHILVLIFVIPVFFLSMKSHSQEVTKGLVTAGFIMPDTICVSIPESIINTSQGDSAWLWRICSGNPVTNPNGIDLGNPDAALNAPWGITLVQDGIHCFAFITNSGDSSITRMHWANGLKGSHTVYNLGNSGILNRSIFGIQVEKDNGNWYGFVNNGTSLVRLDFGTSLLNPSPAAQMVVPLMPNARGLVIENDGNNWVGFATNWPDATITRFNWGNSLASEPVVDTIPGSIGGLTEPMQPALIRDSTGWYLFIANTNSLAQLYFGNSLLNVPQGTNLGDLGSMTDDRGLCLLMECNNPFGIIVNHNTVPNVLLQLHFKGGLAGMKAITPLGNVGKMYLPSALSEAVIIADTIYTIALNESSLTMLFFPPCSDTWIPWADQRDPPPIEFTTPGTYTISLTVNPGMATERRICKEFEVDTPILFNLGSDTTICDGTDFTLSPGTGYRSYLWNTGETTPAIHVTQTGEYSVRVQSPFGCELADSIHVEVVQNLSATVDTSICWGQQYMAEGEWQRTSGTYYDTILIQHGCHKIITTNLLVKPKITVNIGNDTCLVKDNVIDLDASVIGASAYAWQDGSQDSIFRVTGPGTYWVRVMVNKCVSSDTIHVVKCAEAVSFNLPTAFSPNGDGLNDSFGPSGNNFTDFQMTILNRWSQVMFETRNPEQGWDGKYNNEYCEAGIYIYVISYRSADNPDEVIKTTGNLTLVR